MVITANATHITGRYFPVMDRSPEITDMMEVPNEKVSILYIQRESTARQWRVYCILDFGTDGGCTEY